LKCDKEKVSKLVSEAFNAINNLKELVRMPKENFLKNKHFVASAKYFLIVAIEASIDICNHIISKNRFRIPEDYADTFRVMGEAGILEENFVNKLVEMTKFRNRLVHIYWEVDDEIIYDILNEDVQDIERLISELMEKVGD